MNFDLSMPRAGDPVENTLHRFDHAAWQTLGWEPQPLQLHRFAQLYHCVIAGNQQQNLTRITEEMEFWEKHLWDSLRGVMSLISPSDPPQGWQVIDIGTGAGFPGLPLGIFTSAWCLTLLDSTQRRIRFVQETIATLQLGHVQAHADRAERWAQQHRDHYDLAVSRALAAASVCAEYSLPLLKMGGAAILYRGQWTAAESVALDQVVQGLGGIVEQVESFTTPLSQGVRHSVVIRKVDPTPSQYPRGIGIPQRRPLA